MKKFIRKTLLVTLSSAFALQLIHPFSTVYAREQNRIKLTQAQGEYYNQTLNNEVAKSEVYKVQEDREVIVKEPRITPEVSTYSASSEVIEKRTENSKTYEVSPGSYVEEIYFEPVHKKEGSNYVEIDNTLEEKNSFFKSEPTYENKDGLYDVVISDDTFSLKNKEKEEIIFRHPEANLKNYAMKDYVMLYSEAYPNIDLEYRLGSDRIEMGVHFTGPNTKDSISYELNIGDLDVSKEEEHIVLSNNGTEVYRLVAPRLVDQEGKRQEVSVSYQETSDDTLEVTLHLDQEWMNQEDRVYPIHLRQQTRDIEVEDLSVKTSYIRSERPNKPSVYDDLFIGYDYYYWSPVSFAGINRIFLTFPKQDLGENQVVEYATLHLYKEQQIPNQMNTIDVYTTAYVDPVKTTWNNQPTEKDHISTSEIENAKGYQKFDITTHASWLHSGEGERTLILQAADESNAYFANVFNNERHVDGGRRPKIVLAHRDDYNVTPDLDINQRDMEMRVFSKSEDEWKAISLDGIAKPNYDVLFQLYEMTGDGDTYIKDYKTRAYTNFVDPIFVSNPMEDVQTYIQEKSGNYTSDYIYNKDIPKYDAPYELKMVVTDGTNYSEDLYTDRFIVYKVKLGDTLKSISANYGVTLSDIMIDNNRYGKKIKEGDVIFLRYKKNHPKVPKDVYTPPLKIHYYNAIYDSSGSDCYGNCYVGDPINTATGNFYHTSEDVSLMDFGELKLTRTYNSMGENFAGIFGNAFTSNLEQYLSYDAEDNLYYFRGDGKVTYIPKINGVYTPKVEDRIEVSVSGDDITIKNLADEQSYLFDDYGTLTHIQTKQGFLSEIIYEDTYGSIVQMKLGEKLLQFDYNDYNIVNQVTLPNGSILQYEYDDHRNLTMFQDSEGYQERYNYDSSNRISTIIDKNGTAIANNTYDDQGRVLSQTDGNGNTIQLSYNGTQTTKTIHGKSEVYTYNDRLEVQKITKEDGSSVQYAYDDKNNLISETNGLGETKTYTYDQNNLLTSQNFPDGSTETFTYDTSRNVTSHTSTDGQVETWSYDGNNNVTSHTDSKGQTTSYTYSAGLMTSETSSLGASKTYAYTGNQISKVTHSSGLIEEYQYDASGNTTKAWDNQGKVTTSIYNTKNQMTKQIDALGYIEEWKYDGNGNIVEYVDKAGSKTVTTYDKNNNVIRTQKGTLVETKEYNEKNQLVKETNTLGLSKQYTYDANGNQTTIRDERGNVETHAFDALSREVHSVDVYGNETSKTYHQKNLVSEVNALGLETTYDYNEKNQPIKITHPNGTSETKNYTERGQIKEEVDDRGQKKEYTYNANGLVIEEVLHKDSGSITTTYTYDGEGRILQEQVNDAITKNTYDVYGRLIKVEDALGNIATTEYNVLDQKVKEIDALGNATIYRYDALGNEIEVENAKAQSSKKVYDNEGFLLQEIDPLGYATNYAYNSNGQMLSSQSADGRTTKFEYNAFGDVTKTYLEDVLVKEVSYDAYGREVQVKELESDITNTYDTHSRIIETTNNLTTLKTTNTYDEFSNVILEEDNSGMNTTYEYDKYNQVVQTTDALGRKETKTYDASGQVIETTGFDGLTTSSTYDVYGNVIESTDAHGVITYNTYNVLQQVTQTKKKEQVTTYTYDALSRTIETHDVLKDATTKMEYDALGNKVKTTDALGNVSEEVYDAKQRVVQSINALGYITKTSYDIHDNVIEEVDALGNTHQKQYDTYGLLTKEVDARGFLKTYAYNDNLQLISITDETGQTSKRTYNDALQVESESNALGQTTTYEYDIKGREVKQVLPHGKEKTTTYDVLGNILTSKEGELLSENTYDERGNLTEVRINDILTNEQEYDEYNQVINSYDALQQTTTTTYDDEARVISQTSKGMKVDSVYNASGELEEEIKQGTQTTSYTYDLLGRMTVTYDQDIIAKEVGYDALGNEVNVVEDGVRIYKTFDGNNNVTSISDANENVIYRFEYDEMNNVIKETNRLDDSKVYSYDAYNNKASETNALGQTTKYEYDALGNQIKVENALGRYVSYEYNDQNLVSKKKINNKEAVYDYDMDGHVIKEENEYGYVEKHAYDVYGNETTYTKPDGTTITYEYDTLHRKIKEGNKQFTYTEFDEIKEASDEEGSITYEYDAFHNITRVTDTKDDVVTYEYNDRNLNTSMTYPNKEQVFYEYDTHKNLIAVYDNNHELTASYTYDENKNVIEEMNHGIQTINTYDEMFRLQEKTARKNEEVISSLSYAYDGDDNLIKEVIDGLENTYAYDEVGELIESSKYIDGYLIHTTYKYNVFGDRIEEENGINNKIQFYSEDGQVEKIETREGSIHLYYNENGNMRDVTYEDGTHESYTYDQYDRLVTLSSSRDLISEYRYDAQDERIKEVQIDNNIYHYPTYFTESKTLDVTDTRQKVGQLNLDTSFNILLEQADKVEEKGYCDYEELMQQDHEYLNDPKVNYYTVDRNKEYSQVLSKNDENSIYGNDRLSTGDTIYLLGKNETVQKTIKDDTMTSYSYQDFGKTDEMYEDFGYNGEVHDENGLIYLRARYYNTELGRFIQIDTYKGNQDNVESQNRYTYTINNPYKYVDRDGNKISEFKEGKKASNLEEELEKTNKKNRRKKGMKANKNAFANRMGPDKKFKSPGFNGPNTGNPTIPDPNEEYENPFGLRHYLDTVKPCPPEDKGDSSDFWSVAGSKIKNGFHGFLDGASGAYDVVTDIFYGANDWVIKNFNAILTGIAFVATAIGVVALVTALTGYFGIWVAAVSAATAMKSLVIGFTSAAISTMILHTKKLANLDSSDFDYYLQIVNALVMMGTNVLGYFIQANETNNTLKGSTSGNESSKTPVSGEEWNEYFKEQYGVSNVQWKPTSFQDIINDPQRLYGCSATEIQSILPDGWSFKAYGTNGQGWEFYSSEGMIFYHAGGGVHRGAYYGFSTGPTGKVKIVDPNTYLPTWDDGATILPKD